MLRLAIAVALLLAISFAAVAQEFIPLWPAGRMPDSRGLKIKDSIVRERAYAVGTPGIYTFFPSGDDNCGAAVVIFPGGGYSHIALNLGGFQLAKWFNTLGLSAFVVKYRLPQSPDVIESASAPLQDGQRALQLIRSHAAEWGIQKNRIGVLGTSAGGHLASWLGTAIEDITAVNDSIHENAFRPDFMVLISPVIDLGKYANIGSRESLLGKTPSEETIKKYSTQNSVTTSTAPCFIADAFDDKTVAPQNSLLFYQALLDHNVSSSFHVFPQGGHAININSNPGSTGLWKDLCEAWLKEMGFIPVKEKSVPGR